MKKKSLRTVITVLIILVLVTVLAFTGLPLGKSKYYVASVGEALNKGLTLGDGFETVYEYVEPAAEATAAEIEEAVEAVEEAATGAIEEAAEAVDAATEAVEEVAEAVEAAATEAAEEVAEVLEATAADEATAAEAEEPAEPVDVAAAAKQAEKIFADRLKTRGLYESKVVLNDDNTLTVQVPDYDYADIALFYLGQAGNVQFMNDDGVILEKKDLKSCEPFYSSDNDMYYALVSFTKEGREKLAAATADMIGSYMYVCVDGQIFTYAQISEKMDSDTIYMPMMAETADVAYQYATVISMLINSDTLRVTFTEGEITEIENGGSTGLIAGIAVIAIVLACMIYLLVAFKNAGIGAAMGAWAYALIAAYIAVGTGAVMTWLSIIALLLGLALYMYWMIIALKRVKTELDSGRSIDPSFKFGYKQVRPRTYAVALGAIIIAVVLLLILKGNCKPFADTLWIGVVAAFVSAVIIGKPLSRVSARLSVKG